MFSTIISFLLNFSCLALSVYSLFRAPLTSFEVNDEVYTHSLFHSIDVPQEHDRADYLCLKSLSCKNAMSDLCKINTRLTQARTAFFAFEVLAFAFHLFILERLVLKLLRKPNGSSDYFLFLICTLPLIKSIGTAFFLSISEVSFDSSVTRGEIKAELGVYLIIGSTFLSIASSMITVFFNVHKSKKNWKEEFENLATDLFNPFLMFLIAQFLFFLSNVYPISSFNEFTSVKISIDHVNFLENYPENLPIQCIAGQECKVSEVSCKVFTSLSDTSSLMAKLRAFSYIFALLWGESFLHLFLKVRLGTSFLNLMYPVFYFSITLVGFIVYWTKANLGLGSKCNIEEFVNKTWVLCAEIGVSYYFIAVVFTLLAGAVYVLVYLIYLSRKMDAKELKEIGGGTGLENNTKNEGQVGVGSAVQTSRYISAAISPSSVKQITLNEESCYCNEGVEEVNTNERNNFNHRKYFLLKEFTESSS